MTDSGEIRPVRAHAWLKLLLDGSVASLEELARRVGHERIYVRRVLRLAFVSPALTSDILDGRQSAGLLLTDLIETDLPRAWSAQAQLAQL